jgi:transposase InsO family protein
MDRLLASKLSRRRWPDTASPGYSARIRAAQFTSHDFTKMLLDRKIQISMDGRDDWRDNVFVERLWRSVKYEECIFKPTTACVRLARPL